MNEVSCCYRSTVVFFELCQHAALCINIHRLHCGHIAEHSSISSNQGVDVRFGLPWPLDCSQLFTCLVPTSTAGWMAAAVWEVLAEEGGICS